MRNRAFNILLVLTIVCIGFAGQLEPLSHILYGPVENIQKYGDYKVAASGSYILFLDDALDVVAKKSVGEKIEKIDIEGNWLYVATNTGKFMSWDIAAVPNIYRGGQTELGASPMDIEAYGSFVYVATTAGIARIDVSVASSPSILEWLGSTEYLALVKNGSFVYAGKSSGGFDVFSGDGELLGSVPTSGRVSDMICERDKIYLVDNWSKLGIYDISDPGAVLHASDLSLSGPINNIHEHEEMVYVSTSTGRITAVDVTFSDAPRVLGHFSSADMHYEIVIDDGFLYTASLFGGICKLDARSPYDIRESARFDEVGYVTQVKFKDDFAFVAFGTGGFVVLDISNPYDPFVVYQDVLGYASDIELYDDYAYVIDETGDIKIYDIADPSSPIWIHDVEVDGMRLVGLEIKQSIEGDWYLYTMEFSRSIITMDLSDPEAPVPVWETDLHMTSGMDIDQVWNFLAITTSEGFQLYDNLFFPAEPRWYNHFTAPGIINDIASDDAICVVATEDYGAHVIELAHTVPLDTRLATVDEALQVEGVDMINGYAVLACSDDGVMVYDMEYPSNPIAVDKLTFSQAQDVNINPETGIIAASRGVDGLDLIGARTIFERNIQLHAGWNTISLPMLPADTELGTIIPSTDVGCFYFDTETGNYSDPVSSLASGIGYFYFSDRDTVIYFDEEICEEIDPLIVELAPGWNLMGTGSKRVTATELTGRSGFLAQFYYYDPRVCAYVEEEYSLEPDRSYWILALDYLSFNLASGVITLGKRSTGQAFSETDFPPFPPGVPEAGERRTASLPSGFQVASGSPNPFNSVTSVELAIPGETNVKIDVFDLSGRRVEHVMDNEMPAGTHMLRWEPPAESPSGVYLFRVETEYGTATQKLLLAR